MLSFLPEPLPCFKKAIVFFIASLLFIRLSAQPVITAFSPAKGRPGTTVIITGTGFNANPDSNIIYFGSIRAIADAASSTQLSVKVPVGATTQVITVTSGGLTAYSLKPFDITFDKGGGLTGSAFTPAGSLAASNFPYGLAAADIDADGKADLVVVNESSPFSVAVYRNTTSTIGNISFSAPSSIASSIGAYDIATGDLDGDGLLDMVVTNHDNDSITVYRNTSTPGTISFGTSARYKAAGFPWGVIIRDLNADGKPDIIFANEGVGTLSVYTNVSTGAGIQLSSRIDYPNNSYSASVGITAADINGDGKPDIITTGGRAFLSFINRSTANGTISLERTPSIFTGDYPIWLEAGDLDEDGKADIVVTIRNTPNGDGMAIFRNISTDTAFSSIAFSRSFIPVTTAVGRIVMSDLDGDSHIDIANTGEPFSVFRNASTPGMIRMDRPSATANNSMGAAAADFDGDGRPDLVTLHQRGTSLSIFRNTIDGPNVVAVSPDSAVTGATILLYGTNFTGATAVKLGSRHATNFTVLSDTLISVLIDVDVISDSIEVVTPIRSGVLTGYHFLPAPVITGITPAYGMTGSPVTISGRHFKGATAVSFGGQPAARFTVLSDTTISAIVGQGASGAVIVTSKNGNGSLAGFTYITKAPLPVITSFSPLSGPAGTRVTINGANFNPNAASNIVFFGAARATVLSASSTQLVVLAPSGATYQALTVTTGYQTITAAQAFNLSFEGGGTMTDSSFKDYTYESTGNNGNDVAVADLDGDGLNDIAATSYGAENYFSIIRNTSANNILSLAPTINYIIPSNVAVSVGDINSDGKPDLAVTYAQGVYLFKNTSSPGKLSFDTIRLPGSDLTSYTAITDFNVDGRADLVVGYSQREDFLIYKNIGVNDFIAFAPPVTVRKRRTDLSFKTGDIDGDGKPDLLQSNWETGTISIYRNISSGDSIMFAAPVDIYSKAYAFDLAIVDLDGNGKPEVVASNPYQDINYLSVFTNTSTPGNFVLNRQDYVTTLYPTGLSIGDIDGDGKPDVVNVGDGFTVFKNISTPGNVKLDAYHTYKMANTGSGIAVADLSGDGKPDVAADGSSDYRVYAVQNMTGKNLGPAILSFAPAIAKTGDTVIIKGARFSEASTVTLGGTPAGFTVVNDSLITAIVADGSTGRLSINTPYGSVTNDGFVYRLAVPVINEFQPQSGTAGDVVTISGVHFSGVTAVSVGNIPTAGFSILSDTTISVVIGTGASGSVQVATPTDTVSKAGFTYLVPAIPSLTSFSPASAATGMSVTLLGTNLDKTMQVFFGGVPAASFTINSAQSITAVVGGGATGAISINTTDGTASIIGFTFRKPAPVITAFSPAMASYGDTVVIKGNELFNVTAIYFGVTPAASFTALNDSTITALVGTGASGDVYVTTNGSLVSLPGFTYKPLAAVIGSFTPGIAATGDAVTIKGYHFVNVKNVSFGHVPVDSFTIINDSTIIAIVGYGGSNSVTVSTGQDSTTVTGFNYLAPVITSFTPHSGRPGDTVSIYGSYLTGIIGVSFGGIPPAFEKHASNVVTAVLGHGASGTLTVNYYGAQQALGTFTFIYPDPVISDFYPAKAAKGTPVTIYGYFYQPVTRVSFGGYPASSFTADSTHIVAIVGDGGTGNVTVTTDGAMVSLPGFTYLTTSKRPEIISISPDTGRPGTVVHISGDYLDSAYAVSFGGVPAASFEADSNNIYAVVGDGATGEVSVTTRAGTTTYSSFTFISPQPVITAVTPLSGTTGSTIHISGINLDSTRAVSFGSVPAIAFSIDSGFITAIVGNGASGDISISTPYGTAVFPGFTFTDVVNIDVYPNPVQNGRINIRHPASNVTSYITITDMNGMQVLKFDVAAGETVTTISGLNLKSGIYQVIWKDKDKKLVQRIFIP